jgi:hypothetical protein
MSNVIEVLECLSQLFVIARTLSEELYFQGPFTSILLLKFPRAQNDFAFFFNVTYLSRCMGSNAALL